MARLVAALTLLALFAAASGQQYAMQHGGHSHGGGAMAAGPAIASPCVKSPNLAECATWKLPHANAVADSGSLCKAMHFMSACTLAKKCEALGAGATMSTAQQAAISTRDNICRPFQHVATVCRYDTGMARMKGCTNYNAICAAGSKVPQCTGAGFNFLPATRTINPLVRALCTARKSVAACQPCMAAWAKSPDAFGDCDLLSVYSALCRATPAAKECAEFKRMCAADSSLWLCRGRA